MGDGQVNIHDVVRDVQISLETYTPVDCEFVAGDVPTGFGVDCHRILKDYGCKLRSYKLRSEE